MKDFKKNTLLALVFMASSVSFASVDVCITEVDNQSAYPVALVADRTAIFKSLTRTKSKKSFTIPFISAVHYRKQFVRGEPYFPQEALVVNTHLGTIALWEDEVGIMAALKYIPGQTERSACLPRRILRGFNGFNADNALATRIALLLLVSKQGSLSLDEI